MDEITVSSVFLHLDVLVSFMFGIPHLNKMMMLEHIAYVRKEQFPVSFWSRMIQTNP